MRIERLTPRQIEREIGKRSLVYVPVGTYEWHGHHLPIGLDALVAHQTCLDAAKHTGGLVCPPLFYGTGGGHLAYPWTVMVDAEHLRALLDATVRKFKEWDVKRIVLYTGHFPPEQRNVLDEVAAAHSDAGTRVLSLCAVLMTPRPEVKPDHAALFETSLMHAIDPSLVHLEELPGMQDVPANDPDGKTSGPHRHDPSHVLYGIFGEDPRKLDPHQAERLYEQVVNWLAAEVEKAGGPE